MVSQRGLRSKWAPSHRLEAAHHTTHPASLASSVASPRCGLLCRCMAFCYYNTSSATLVLPPVVVGGELHSWQSAKSLTAAHHRSLENTATHTSSYSSQHLSSALHVGGESGPTNNATLVLFIRVNVLTSPGGVPNHRPCNSTFHVFCSLSPFYRPPRSELQDGSVVMTQSKYL